MEEVGVGECRVQLVVVEVEDEESDGWWCGELIRNVWVGERRFGGIEGS